MVPVFLICMGQYLTIQKKAQNELDEILEQNKIPAITDQGQLPYVKAVIKKVMRQKPLLPLGIPWCMYSSSYGHRVQLSSI